MADVFISYSSKDRPQAMSLVEQLRSSGYSVWIDQGGIEGAMNWSSEIVEAINDCKTLLFLISGNSIKSENIAREIHLASEKRKSILPVVLERVQLPVMFEYPLSGLQRLKYENTPAIEKALAAMLKGKSASDALSTVSTDAKSEDGFVHLAVLPFDDLSSAHDNDWFADGMTDELINTLGTLEKMKVPGRNDIMFSKKNRPRTKEIADDLKVRYIVDGSVRKAGEKIRITASLMDVLDNRQLWSHNYDGVFDNIFELQDTVAKQIAESLKLKLTPMDIARIEDRPTENVEAYELYLRGMEFQRRITRDGYERAIKLYQETINLDPKFVIAYLELASTYVAYYRECSRDKNWLLRAEENLIKAEDISGQTAKTLWIHGEIAWQKEDFENAERILLLAINTDPTYQASYNILGNLYLRTGKTREAASAFEKAAELQKTTFSYFNFLAALFASNNNEKVITVAQEALPVFQKHILRNPDDMISRVNSAFILFWAGQKESSFSEAETLSQVKDLDGMALFNLGALYGELGHPDKNIILFKRALNNGFRELEALINYDIGDKTFQPQLEGLVTELKAIIRAEATISQ